MISYKAFKGSIDFKYLVVVPPVKEDPHHQEGRVLVCPESDKMRCSKMFQHIL